MRHAQSARGREEGCVLITGGAGFIGSHLADLLLAQGRTVRVLDDLSTGSLDNLAHLASLPRFRFIRGDVQDPELVSSLVADCAHVYHLAAVVGVQLVMQSPLRVVDHNVQGTRSVLAAVQGTRARVFLASSSEVYGRNGRPPSSEESECVLGPPQVARWSYAVSKMAGEILGLGHAAERGVEVVVGRLFNTIGTRQSGRYGMVVPRFVKAALAGGPIQVYGDGSQTRSFCDVRDTVRALAALMAHPSASGGVYNIGSPNEISIGELALRVLRVVAPERLGQPDAIQYVDYAEAYPPGYEDAPRRLPDTGRIAALLGWVPRHGLDETISWIAHSLRHTRTA